ncbi:MAG: hypothetical protein LBD04_08070 [Synergistaceae bacterium]|jgi:medium-chain acyl-[acyl-carrier-protein] hydrolase|nr:hypothetical protein [Synergistaceae bacterium]
MVYRRRMIVMPSETACTNEIKIHALLNRLQDTAGLAVADTEGAPVELMRRGYGWVLLKYGLEVLTRLPGMDEPLVIETRHTAGDGFHTLRVFRVFREADEAETLVVAKTSWVLIDLAAGRPVRATQRLPGVFSRVDGDDPIDEEFAEIPRFSGARLKDEPVLTEAVFPVRFHDLDANGHVNNAVYFEWAWEATPLDPLGWSVREMHAEFRVSVKLGETALVRVKTLPAEGGIRSFAYDIVEKNGDPARPLARFSSVWAPLSEPKGP